MEFLFKKLYNSANRITGTLNAEFSPQQFLSLSGSAAQKAPADLRPEKGIQPTHHP